MIARAHRFAGAALAAGLVLVAGPVTAQPPRYAGRPLADVLRELQSQGLKLVYSSELVRPDMRVTIEPRIDKPRRMLEAMLRPHGLAVQEGPGGTLLVVRSRRPPLSDAAGGAKGRIVGSVVDARTGAPLASVSVGIQGREGTVTTDAAGAFTLSGLPPGRHVLFVSLVGYSLARPAIELPAGGSVRIEVPLADGTTTYTERVTVTADPFRAASPATPAEQSLTSAELQKLRGVLTDDPFRAVQSLPGVSATSDVRSEFSVRASNFRHMGLSIDGLPTRWLVHNVRNYENKGSIAMLNSDVIDSAVLSSGAQPQVQPGRLGAWLDLRIREGSRDATRFHGGVSMTSASAVADGPLGGNRRGSWLVSFRQSYVQWLIKRIQVDDTAFGFTDVQTKLIFDATPKQQLQLGVLAGRSQLDQTVDNPSPNELRSGTMQSGLVWLGWRSSIGHALVIDQRAAIESGGFENTHESGRALATGSRVEASYWTKATWAPRPSLTIRAAGMAERAEARQDEIIVPTSDGGLVEGRRTEHVDGTAWTLSADAGVGWALTSGVAVDAGSRVARSTLIDDTTVSPWLLGKAPVGRWFSILAGVSVPHQMPDFEQVVGTYGLPSARAERARAIDVTLEARPTPTVRWQAIFYDRHEKNVLRLENSETHRVDGRLIPGSTLAPAWQNALEGRARGIELVAQRRSASGLSGWVAYAYGRARYTDADRHETFWADLDQRHTVSVFLEDRVSSSTSVGLKLRMGSGVPLPGYFDEREGGLYAGSTRNAVRLPYYSRLDLRADHAFNYQRSRLTLFAEVVNVLNRTNYAPDYGGFGVGGQAINFTSKQFPILPSVGIRLEF